MVAARVTCALIVGCLTTSAIAEERRASFGVSMRVVRSLRTANPDSPLVAFVGKVETIALPCGSPRSPACEAATSEARASPASRGPVVLTILADGSPTGIVER
jgi:hypothetical protein